jgi:hypothetical protein
MRPELTDLLGRGYPAHNIQVREQLVQEKITLNDEPAVIATPSSQFAHVRQMPTGLQADWSWAAVLHVIQYKGGAFES